jgi:hypothetical protein
MRQTQSSTWHPELPSLFSLCPICFSSIFDSLPEPKHLSLWLLPCSLSFSTITLSLVHTKTKRKIENVIPNTTNKAAELLPDQRTPQAPRFTPQHQKSESEPEPEPEEGESFPFPFR